LLWNLETNAATPLLDDAVAGNFTASPDGDYFAVLVYQGNTPDIRLITKDGKPVRQLEHLTDTPISSMMFSADSKRFVATTTDFLEDMLVWEVSTGHGEIRQPNFGGLESTAINYRGINARSYLLPDGEDLLIVPDRSDMLRVNTTTGKIETIYADSNRSIYQVALNEQLIVANLCLEEVEFACNQAGLRIWNTVTGAQLADIRVDGILDTLNLGRTQILARVGFSQFHYRLETPFQLVERLEQEGRIRSFTPDECRRFALTCG
jgi:WD40 repeat protein